MNLKILSEKITVAGDKVYQIQIPPAEMIYFGYIVESLEGWAFHTIIDKKENLLHLEIIKDYVSDFDKIFEKLKEFKITS